MPFLGNVLRTFTSKASEGSVLYRIAPMPELYNDLNSIREIEKKGIIYKLDLSDLMDWWFYWGFKDEAHEFLFTKIKPGNIVVDVGANKCILTSLFSDKVTKKGKVYSFEANPDSYLKSRSLIAKNSERLNNCVLIGKACGSTYSTMQIARTAKNNTGMDRLVSIDSTEGLGNNVEVVRLDRELENLESIDLIKIDTEGFELEVLKGAKEILEKFKPKLFVELDKQNLDRYNANFEQVIEFLKPFGYSFYNVQSSMYFNSEVELGENFHFDCYCEI